MNIATAVPVILVGIALLLALTLLVLGTVALARYAFRPRGQVDLSPTEDLVDEWTARTPAGPATITRIVDDRGARYLIETSFHGEEPHRYTTPPAFDLARRKLTQLINEHLANRETSH